MSSRFSSNSEADASELLENREEMLPRYACHEKRLARKDLVFLQFWNER